MVLVDERFQLTYSVCINFCFVVFGFSVSWWFCRCWCRLIYIIASKVEMQERKSWMMARFVFLLFLSLSYHRNHTIKLWFSCKPCKSFFFLMCEKYTASKIKLAKRDKEYYITYFDFDGNLLFFLNPRIYSSHQTCAPT